MESCWRLSIIISSLVIALSCQLIDGGALREKRQSNQPKRIVCFYAYWAANRPGEYRFTPRDINPHLCTHIVYSYARPEMNEGIVPYDFKVDIEEGGWSSMVDLKKINPDAKIMLSVGGLFEGSTRFSKIAGDVKQRSIFVESITRELRRYGFEGIDITWLFPGFSEGSTTADKVNYVNLIKELKEELKDDFILSLSVPALKQYIESGINVTEMLKYVEFMNVLAYSYHDSTDATVNHHGPLYSLPDDPGNRDANVDTTIREYLARGARPDQLNLIIPLYGVAFTLEDPNNTDIGANTEDEGIGLEEPGALIYFELCQKIRKEGWTVKRVNSTAMGPYAYKDKLWVAYDDEEMIRNKGRYALQKGLGGLGFWTIDQDDFKGLCQVLSFPLLRAGRDAFLGVSDNIQATTAAVTATVATTSAAVTPSFTTPTPASEEVNIPQGLIGRPSKQLTNKPPRDTISMIPTPAVPRSIKPSTLPPPPDAWTSSEGSGNRCQADLPCRR